MGELKFRRWYDRDPLLSKAMKILETSGDKFQIQVAINLIKIVIEHKIENNTLTTVEDIMRAVEDGKTEKGNSRWYDIDQTIRTSIQMLENCPEEMQEKISHEIAAMVTEKIQSAEEDMD